MRSLKTVTPFPMETPNPRMTPTPGKPQTDGFAAGAAAIWSLLGAVVVGLGSGLAIDSWAGTGRMWTLILTGFFLVAGLYGLVKEMRR